MFLRYLLALHTKNRISSTLLAKRPLLAKITILLLSQAVIFIVSTATQNISH
jgi:hypothetical protein